jgi:hypothetical protein
VAPASGLDVGGVSEAREWMRMSDVIRTRSHVSNADEWMRMSHV